jgi:hypothetical protein
MKKYKFYKFIDPISGLTLFSDTSPKTPYKPTKDVIDKSFILKYYPNLLKK